VLCLKDQWQAWAAWLHLHEMAKAIQSCGLHKQQ